MNKQAYQVGVLNRLSMSATMAELAKMHTGKQLHQLQEYPDDPEEHGFILRALIYPTPDIQTFYQPILLASPSGINVMVVDLRLYQKSLKIVGDNNNPMFSLADATNVSIFRLLYDAIFTGIWQKSPELITSNLPLTAEVYASSITSSVSAKLGLEPEPLVYLLSAFQIFFTTRSMVGYGSSLSPKDKELYLINLARKYKGDVKRYSLILDALQETDLLNLDNYCKFIAKQNWSVRLGSFSARDLFLLMGRIWTDVGNPKETIAVALEFPPTFLSILFTLAQFPAYLKHSPISMQLKPQLNSNNVKSFILTTRQLAQLTF